MIDASAARLPVTVIGGYLGSGKTSLVNHILRTATERIAVLVNDFGALNIDAESIAANDGALPDGVIALANGCICCTLADGFSSALDSIAGLDNRPDRLVIEASGVSDPAQVAAYCHAPGFTLEAVIVLVDVETIRERVDDAYVGQTVVGQLRAADVVVLNKTDLIDEAALDSLRGWAHERCTDAVVVSAKHGAIAPEVLFGRPADPQEPSEPAAPDAAHAGFHSWSVSRDRPVSRSAVDALMSALPDAVIRAKGFVLLDDVPDRQMIVQRVGRRWRLQRGPAWPSEASTRLVFIATDPGTERTVIDLIDRHLAGA